MDALQNLDQVVEKVQALVVEERHREAIPPSAARPANAVDTTLDLLRHVVVDDELVVGDVQPAARVDRRHKDRRPSLADQFEAVVVLALRALAMDRVDDKPWSAKKSSSMSHPRLVSTKTTALCGFSCVKMSRIASFFWFSTTQKMLRGRVDGAAILLDSDEGVVLHEVARELLDRAREGRAEHHRLPRADRRHLRVLEMRWICGAKPMSHPVRLVDDQVADFGETGDFPVGEVHQPPRRRDEDVAAADHLQDLRVRLDTAVNDDGADRRPPQKRSASSWIYGPSSRVGQRISACGKAVTRCESSFPALRGGFLMINELIGKMNPALLPEPVCAHEI